MQRLHAQISDDLFLKVHATEFTASDITRRALEEYFHNHPEIKVIPEKQEGTRRKMRVYLNK